MIVDERLGVVVRVGAVLVFLMLAAGLVLPASAQEPQRFALLIGNQGYHASVGALKNPHNDIAVVGAALQRQGFNVLPAVKEAKRAVILGAVRELVKRLNGAGAGAVGFVYYSGHGAAEKGNGVNYIIPIDVRDPGSPMFWDESLKLDDILALLEGARGAAKFIVFDACRNELQLAERTADKGLVPVREHQGMLVAYATAPGRTASDRGAASGPYAAALAAELQKPGLDHLGLFQNVKEAVYATTGGVQQPWNNDGLVRRVYLNGLPKGQPVAGGPQSVAPPNTALAGGVEQCRVIAANTSIGVVEAMAKSLKGTPAGACAEARLAELRRKQRPVAAPVQVASASEGTARPAGSRAGRDCPGCPDMVPIAAGRFTMGSEQGDEDELPEHTVAFAKGWAIARSETTNGQWAECVRDGACTGGGGGAADAPVANVSWEDARGFTAWLSRKSGRRYRLPTEAEWEYSARGGASGQAIGNANCRGCGPGMGTQALPVGRFPANGFGLHDMLGNVAEWVEDCQTRNYLGASSSGAAMQSGDCRRRGVRGGSWYQERSFSRASDRNFETLDRRAPFIGFRVVRDD